MFLCASVYSLTLQDFPLLHSVHKGSEAHPSLLPKGYGGVISSMVKRAGSEAEHSPLPSAEVKNCGGTSPLLDMSPWHTAKLIKQRGNFILPLLYRN
jgi:hypothetical protein